MKVCYVTMAFPAPAETFAASDVRALLRAGDAVTVHSMRPADPNASMMTSERQLHDVVVTHNSVSASLRGLRTALREPVAALQVLAWMTRHLIHQPGQLARSLLLLPRCFDILDAIERDRPDVVHLFWGHYPALVGHLVRWRLPALPLTIFLGAYDLTMRYGPSRPVARAANIVWTHARENVSAIAQLGVPAQAVRVVYRGTEFKSGAAQLHGKTPFRIVVVSRLIAAKAVDDALRVFSRVRASWPEATLQILGDGPERERLVALAADLGMGDSVSFRGHVSHDAVRSAMADAQILVLMSRKDSERLPNVVKEAMASGCICVVTQSPGIEELVADGVTGEVVAPGAIADAARRIDAVFGDATRTRAMAIAAERHVRTHFDVNRSMAAYRDAWADLVAATRPVPAPRIHPPAHSMVPSGQRGEVECA